MQRFQFHDEPCKSHIRNCFPVIFHFPPSLSLCSMFCFFFFGSPKNGGKSRVIIFGLVKNVKCYCDIYKWASLFIVYILCHPAKYDWWPLSRYVIAVLRACGCSSLWLWVLRTQAVKCHYFCRCAIKGVNTLLPLWSHWHADVTKLFAWFPDNYQHILCTKWMYSHVQQNIVAD